MQSAAKKKSLSPAGLTALRVLLLLVVTLCLGQTRVWGFGITAPPASGVFESANPSSIGENTIAWQYDASDSPLAARGGAGPVLQGQAGVTRAIGEIEAGGGTILGREITLQAGTVRTRPDLLVRNADGSISFVEVKSGAGAALTPNQNAGFPIIQSGGAVPRGANAAAAGLEVGAPLPPTPVQVIRY